MIFFGFIAHWLACIWFVIGVNHTEEYPIGKCRLYGIFLIQKVKACARRTTKVFFLIKGGLAIFIFSFCTLIFTMQGGEGGMAQLGRTKVERPLSTKRYFIFGQCTANYCRTDRKLSWGFRIRKSEFEAIKQILFGSSAAALNLL